MTSKAAKTIREETDCPKCSKEKRPEVCKKCLEDFSKEVDGWIDGILEKTDGLTHFSPPHCPTIDRVIRESENNCHNGTKRGNNRTIMSTKHKEIRL